MSRTSCGKLVQSPASLASQYPPLYLQRQQLASVRVQLRFHQVKAHIPTLSNEARHHKLIHCLLHPS